MSTDPWLLVIDPQRIFADPESPWGSPMFAGVVPVIRSLAAGFPQRIVVTRFVADDDPRGSWRPYYEQFPFARVPDADPLYEIVPDLADLAADAPVVTEHTFGKWGRQLADIVGPTPDLVLAGVSTDCCVISTALAAADAGASITVVTDACAGSTPENHAAALQVMGLYAPQVTPATAADVTTDDHSSRPGSPSTT